ncbi:MAG: TIGR03089 family protein [Actinomycetota bacterium]|nr:TIGR03089 family protein [Actinomycetota bacterium]
MHQLTITGTLLGPLLAGDPHTPRLVTYTGQARTELSTASLANWSAKVAGLLVDELGLTAGELVAVRLGAGWQTAPILLGCWWAGATVTTADPDDPDDSVDSPAAAAFVADGEDANADEVFVVSGHPLGAPASTVLAHQRDFTTAVLGQADQFSELGGVVDGGAAALSVGATTLSVDAVVALARASAERFGSGARVLSAAPWTMPDPLLPLLLGTLAADGSLVQLIGDDAPAADHVAATEKCTVRWG